MSELAGGHVKILLAADGEDQCRNIDIDIRSGGKPRDLACISRDGSGNVQPFLAKKDLVSRTDDIRGSVRWKQDKP